MTSAYRNRLVTGFGVSLLLALTTACSTMTVEPSASPRTDDGSAATVTGDDQERCVRDGGVWRIGMDIWGGGACERSGVEN
jgi:hypothetical protein